MSADTPFVQKDEIYLSHSKTKSGGSSVLACIIELMKNKHYTIYIINLSIKKKLLSTFFVLPLFSQQTR